MSFSGLKRLFVGRPLPRTEQDHQRLPKTIALSTFSSDPISSTAYATEEILFITAVRDFEPRPRAKQALQMSLAVAFLLAIVVASYRQTLFAYPVAEGPTS